MGLTRNEAQMVQQPLPPRPSDPHDKNIEDDSLLRPFTTPPERDRIQAFLADEEASGDLTPETAQEVAAGNTTRITMLPMAIVVIVVVALLVWWLM